MGYNVIMAGLLIPSFLLSMEQKGAKVSLKISPEVLFHLDESRRLHIKSLELPSITDSCEPIVDGLKGAMLIKKGFFDEAFKLLQSSSDREYRLGVDMLSKWHFEKAMRLLKDNDFLTFETLMTFSWFQALHSKLVENESWENLFS